MSFPETRPRRLRRTPALRRMVRETTLAPDNFIYPLFVGPGKGVRREISSLPGQFQFSVGRGGARGRGGREARHPVGDPVRPAREEGRGRQRGVAQRRRRAARAARDQEGGPRAGAGRRRLLLRVHDARPLRRRRRRRDRQRRDAGQPRARGAVVRARGRRPGRAVGDDGRLRRVPARIAGRGRLREGRPARLFGQVRLRATTARSGPRSIRRPRSAIAPATRWIRRTCARRCASSRSTSRRAPTS